MNGFGVNSVKLGASAITTSCVSQVLKSVVKTATVAAPVHPVVRTIATLSLAGIIGGAVGEMTTKTVETAIGIVKHIKQEIRKSRDGDADAGNEETGKEGTGKEGTGKEGTGKEGIGNEGRNKANTGNGSKRR